MTGKNDRGGAYDLHDSVVYILDDDPTWLQMLGSVVGTYGFKHIIASKLAREFLARLASKPIDVLILDLGLLDATGVDILRQMTEEHPDIPVIVVSGSDDQRTAVDCIRQGAFNFFHKTEDISTIVAEIEHALRIRRLQQENSVLRDAMEQHGIAHPENFLEIVTTSAKMNNIFQYIEAVASSSEPLLITGETGTGKELVARAAHKASGRSGRFVPVNIAGVDDHVLSDSLFGHVKGAFTGATNDKSGLFEEAEDGTLFLDEIGALSLDSQLKLLRVIQEKEYFRLGNESPVQSKARIVLATNRPLFELKDESVFRQDLFYRIATHLIEIPALRERREDLPALLDFFLKESANEMNKTKPAYSPELIGLLNTYRFPGNVRELRSMIFDAVSRHRAKILSHDVFRERMNNEQSSGCQSSTVSSPSADFSKTQAVFGDTLPTIDALTDKLIQEALARTRGNKSQAADILGINRTTLVKRLRRKDNV